MEWVKIGSPFLGAVALEAVHWYQLRERSESATFRLMFQSVSYWVITVVMIVVGGIGSLILFGDRLNQAELFLAGAAFPAVLTKLVAAFVKEPLKLGREGSAPVASYFGV